MPEKGVFTITEVVVLSIVWSSCQFVWTNVIRTGLGDALGRLSLGKYATDALVAITLLVVTIGLIFLFSNIQVGKSSLFFLTEDEPGINLPFRYNPDPQGPGTFSPPAATETFALQG